MKARSKIGPDRGCRRRVRLHPTHSRYDYYRKDFMASGINNDKELIVIYSVDPILGYKCVLRLVHLHFLNHLTMGGSPAVGG